MRSFSKVYKAKKSCFTNSFKTSSFWNLRHLFTFLLNILIPNNPNPFLTFSNIKLTKAPHILYPREDEINDKLTNSRTLWRDLFLNIMNPFEDKTQ